MRIDAIVATCGYVESAYVPFLIFHYIGERDFASPVDAIRDLGEQLLDDIVEPSGQPVSRCCKDTVDNVRKDARHCIRCGKPLFFSISVDDLMEEILRLNSATNDSSGYVGQESDWWMYEGISAVFNAERVIEIPEKAEQVIISAVGEDHIVKLVEERGLTYDDSGMGLVEVTDSDFDVLERH